MEELDLVFGSWVREVLVGGSEMSLISATKEALGANSHLGFPSDEITIILKFRSSVILSKLTIGYPRLKCVLFLQALIVQRLHSAIQQVDLFIH